MLQLPPGKADTFYNVYAPFGTSAPDRIVNIPGSPDYYYSPYHYRAGPGVPNSYLLIKSP
jgi:hypothetical protein